MRLSWIVLLAACRPALSFAPDRLPDATVGQPYHATIEVSGGETPVGNISAAIDDEPSRSNAHTLQEN
jgi:hypothetical protein